MRNPFKKKDKVANKFMFENLIKALEYANGKLDKDIYGLKKDREGLIRLLKNDPKNINQ